VDYHAPRPVTSTEFMIVVEMLQALTERLPYLRECPAQPAHAGSGDSFVLNSA
jgi:hypothetical protein